MTTHIVTSWAIGDKAVAVTQDREEAEQIALTVAANTGRTTTVVDSPLDLANARLRNGLCPECGSANVHKYRRPVPGDPGDVDGAADCRDCGWGY